MMVEPFVPLSVIGLDIDEPPNGWVASLTERDIKVHLDDLGRLSVSRDDARRLFTERREAAEKARELAEANERRAVEADRQWRAQLPRGAAWYDVPAGVHPATAMLAAARDAEPRTVPSRTQWLFDEGVDSMVYHPMNDGEDAS